ncbi:FAD binding domain-containing protein [Apiospora kogelbergensis]|uniref:FAD binding domain-containing protein n=1 Tax=Apiospora kogelbergensis TaxID=1337665 RepID=UPI003131C7F2
MGENNNNDGCNYDVIVIGSGLAGISAAREALEHDETLTVLLIDENGTATCTGGDLELLKRNDKTSAEIRAWLQRCQGAAAQDKESSLYRRLLCVAWPFRHGRRNWRRERKRKRAGTPDASESLLEGERAREGASEGPLLRLEYRPACRVVRLVCGHDGGAETLSEKDDNKAVTGVECNVLPRATDHRRRVLKQYLRRLTKRTIPHRKSGATAVQVSPKRIFYRARVGVVLATGNPNTSCSDDDNQQLMLGSDSDGDSPGVELARQVGGAVAFISCYVDDDPKGPSSSPSSTKPPPLARAHMCGIAVSRATGQRFAAEDLHTDVFTKELRRKADGEAFLIKKEKKKEKKEKRKTGEPKDERKQDQQHSTQPHQKAKTLDALAQKIGVDADGLGKAVSTYNEAIRAGGQDAFRKSPEHCRAVLKRAPFYALDISAPLERGRSPTPRRRTSLVELIRVDEGSGIVLDAEGRQIRGLYAAGRCATVSSGSDHCSGLAAAPVKPLDGKSSVGPGSPADCASSGRRAGGHAAAASRAKNRSSGESDTVAKG